jgi:aminoglycoside phosphotransferase (APT) family kinase protein
MDKTASITEPTDIESPFSLLGYLRHQHLIGPGDIPRMTVLQGGVSNKTVLVEPSGSSPFVLKQALQRLRVVADWRCDPARIHREALALRSLPSLTPPGTITPLNFEDLDQHIIAMEAVPAGHENWKIMLLARGPESEHVARFADVLASIHRRSSAWNVDLRRPFEDRAWFNILRLEPFYQYTAERVPAARAFLTDLVSETLQTSLALVHGDYSPKNVLIYGDRLILLDHEVAHFGDPAFDVGFSLTHLLSKAHHCRGWRAAFFAASTLYSARYLETIQTCWVGDEFEARACRHTIGCLLARVDGRSPLEYLSGVERTRQRQIALHLISGRPVSLAGLIQSFQKELACLESSS